MQKSYNISIKALSTWVFVASFFFIEISYGGSTLFSIPLYRVELGLNIILSIVVYHLYPPSLGQTRRLISVLVILAVVQLFYLLVLNVYPIAGSLNEYAIASVRVYGYVVSVTTYACVLYDEELLLRAFYTLGRICLGVGLVALALYEVTGHPFMVDLAYGNSRTQAFFTEPSGAAPAVAVVGILAWKKRDWIGLGLALIFALTASSPTVLIVFILSILGIYFARRGPWAVWTGIFGLITLVVAFVMLGGMEWLKTAPYFGTTTRRFARGIEFALTLSQQGYNPRFAGAINVYEHLKDNGLLWIGYGLNSAAPYFEHVYTDTITTTQDYSLFLTVFFSFGVIGGIVFLWLSYRSVRNTYLQKSKIIYIFVPFFITSMINSAGGFITYKFVILVLVIYGLKNNID